MIDAEKGIFDPMQIERAIRAEVTRFGNVYFSVEILSAPKDALKGKTCLVSRSRNVAQFYFGLIP